MEKQKIGYARVSTKKQNISLQVEALNDFGCSKIIKEKASVAEKRPLLDELLESLKNGDTLVVWKLDRLGREMFSLFEMIGEFNNKGVNFVSLTENIDTTQPIGKLLLALSAYFAEMERSIIKERREAGIEIAKRNGKMGGRPIGMLKRTKEITPTVISMYKEKLNQNEFKYSTYQIAKILDISRNTIYKILKENNIPRNRVDIITFS